MAEIIITDANFKQFIWPATVDGEQKGMGLVPRNFDTHPVGYGAAKPFDLPIIPRNEWQSRINDIIAAKAQLSDVRNTGMNGQRIPSRDQNGKGYCWAHSTVSAMLIVRALNNQPYVDLSAFAIACIIKGYKDEGGWGAESLEWAAANGCPSSEFWPQQSMSRSNDTPAMRENAKLHIITEWMDLDPSNMEAQMMTCLLSGIPVVSDFNWWSHSVCTIDVYDLDTTGIWNSWGDSWSQLGVGKLQGRKRIPDGAIAPRVVAASLA